MKHKTTNKRRTHIIIFCLQRAELIKGEPDSTTGESRRVAEVGRVHVATRRRAIGSVLLRHTAGRVLGGILAGILAGKSFQGIFLETNVSTSRQWKHGRVSIWAEIHTDKLVDVNLVLGNVTQCIAYQANTINNDIQSLTVVAA